MKRMMPAVWTLALVFGLSGFVAAQEPKEDPIFEISIEMHSVVGKLSKQSTDKPTQENQQEVVNKLDVLIAKLEEQAKQNSSGSGASNANPNKPLNESKIIGGPGGSGKLHASRQDGKQWGELPAHERDRILQSLTEGFPPHYQKLLERYYKRLADEKPVTELADEAADGKPTPKKSNPKPDSAPKNPKADK